MVSLASPSERDYPGRIEKLEATPLLERVREETDPRLEKQLRVAAAVVAAVEAAGGRALVVGGFVRDEALRLLVAQGEELPWLIDRNVHPNDVDLEIYGLEYGRLEAILGSVGKFDTRGEQFRVLNIGGVDVSIPRCDSKIAPGHCGFKIEGNPFMPFGEASRRRDFTVNAIALNPLTGEFLDEQGGISDLREGVLRAVDPERFVDDPLRPLRAMAFAARRGFSIDPRTVSLCREVNLRELPKERVGGEWGKLLRAPRPALGLKAALDLGILDKLHPDLRVIAADRQRWDHLCAAADAAVAVARECKLDSQAAGTFVLATLCLPLEEFGARRFLSQLNIAKETVRRILPLVAEYPFDSKIDEEAVRRRACRLYPASIEEFCWVLRADNGGQPTEAAEELLAVARRLGVERRPPVPLISGDVLLEMGVPEGPRISEIINAVFEDQLRGEVNSREKAGRLVKAILGGR